MDIIKKYKKHKKISNLSIIGISLVLALGINFLVINNSGITSNLKTSILENEGKNDLGDIYMENQGTNIIIKSSKQINDVTNITLSISYNPENVVIKNILPKYNGEISNISNVDGLSTIILDYSESNIIKANEKIITINTEKKIQKTENINIINANFTDKDNNTYELTTSGVTY